jgi:hypothetical protein
MLESDINKLRNRIDLLSLGAVGAVGIFRIEEYAGGGGVDVASAAPVDGTGVLESSRVGNAGGSCGSGC